MRAIRKDLEPVGKMMDRLSMPIPECGCYAWLGKLGTGDYAYVAYREEGRRLHRKAATVALELVGRPRPEGLEVSHTCDMRWCVNPDHMVWETHAENLQRRAWQPKGQRYVLNCKHCGAPKERVTGKQDAWVCKPCRARRAKEWREQTNYNSNEYRAVNRDRINEQRRERRHRSAGEL